MRVGVIGLGKLGLAMSKRLVNEGFDLKAWNRSPKDDGALGKAAGRVVGSVAELADHAEALVIVVGDDAALREVSQNLAERPLAGKTVVQMSTVHPATAVEAGRALAAAGAAFVDAPVSGTVGPARQGQLLILAGAEADDLARAKPVLDALGRRTAHMGGVGKGSLMKLVVNQMLGVYWEALSESLAVGQLGGLEVPQMLDAIRDTSVGVPMLEAKRGLHRGSGRPRRLRPRGCAQGPARHGAARPRARLGDPRDRGDAVDGQRRDGGRLRRPRRRRAHPLLARRPRWRGRAAVRARHRSRNARDRGVLDMQSLAPVTGAMLAPIRPMRLLLAAAFVAVSGAALAQGAPASATPAPAAPVESKPGAPAATPSSPARTTPSKGRAAAPAQTPAQAAAAKEAALNAEAKKAREEQERRMKERDRKLEGLMKSICKGC
jgi:3-hydroxyisobutyrate dehydrogenase-like beta-hydroxyacid dehydrogenase